MAIKIVAEIGCNHNGNVEIAKQMIQKAAECGADAVKFQTFTAENLVTPNTPKAAYQQVNCGSDNTQLQMLKELELKQEEYMKLLSVAREAGIEMFSTPFDIPAIDFLIRLQQKNWKIPSGEITNLPYLRKIADAAIPDKKIFLSTGMSTMEDIQAALSVLDPARNQITLLHCNTEYPTVDEDMNLRVLLQFRQSFSSFEIGLSDHSLGITAALVAVGMGICYLEKHFTLDRNMKGPDHKASLEPDELRRLCTEVRRAENMLGHFEKTVTPSEQRNQAIARKSIVAACDIKKGEIFGEHNLTCKRPGTGISPMLWNKIIGLRAPRDFSRDELIALDSLSNKGEC